ncbi:MAG TPA: hypothetical protein PK082_02345 [Phycisphaerae bacterium]|nr:hypothetical protein [Phycisphaerae bacterium]
MKTFTDNAGRSWTVEVNVAAVKRVRGLLDVDLLDAAGSKLIGRLIDDPVLLCDLVYCLCKPQADAQDVGDEDFGKAMAGDAIEAATTALLEELTDFFPSPKRRLIRTMLEKLRAIETLATELATRELESPELESRLRAEREAGTPDAGTPDAEKSGSPQPTAGG